MGELYLVSNTTKRLLRQLQERVSKLFKLQRSDRKKSNRPNGFLNTEKFISVFNAKLLHRFVFKVKEPREFVYICIKFLVDRTLRQYREAMGRCRDLFSKKMKDYGTAWRILRVPSLVDQIFIKAKRIRTIEEKGVQAVSDSIETEYIGVVNYSLMALIQLDLKESEETKVEEAIIMESFNRKAIETELLMQAKNHDYGEAWRDMKCSSLTDLILMKVLRIKQIMSNASQTLVSEGLGANFQDITNYAVFALIKIEEQKIKTPGR